MVRLFICGLSSFNPLLASFCFSKTSSLPVQSTLPMPRSAEPRSRRAAKERERRAVEAPASHQAGLDTVKARDRRAAETPPPRQARLASDWLIATLLGTSYDFTHVRAPSESWTSPSLSPQESRRFGCSQDFSKTYSQIYRSTFLCQLSPWLNVLAILAQLALLICKCVLRVARGTLTTRTLARL